MKWPIELGAEGIFQGASFKKKEKKDLIALPLSHMCSDFTPKELFWND